MTEFYEVEKVVNVIENGGIVLYPTDTIWGVGCDATNPQAIEKIFNLRKQPKEKDFILLVDSIEMLKDCVKNLHPRIETLMLYHKRPLTILYDDPKDLPNEVLNNDGTISIRLTQDRFCQQTIRRLGKPIVFASAAVADRPFQGHFGSVSSDIIIGVDYVVRYRQKESRTELPSVVMKMDQGGELIVVRS